MENRKYIGDEFYPPLIESEIFDQVQNRRQETVKSLGRHVQPNSFRNQTQFSGTLWSKYGMKKAVWRCDNRLKHGSKRCKHSPTLKEDSLHEAIMTAINNVVEDQGEFVQAFRENVIRIIGSYSAQAEPTEYDEQIEQLQQEMMKLIEESAKAECADDCFLRTLWGYF